MLHGGVLVVTVPAFIFTWGHRARRFCGIVEIEIRPLIRKARLILHFDIQAHQRFLIAALLIDRAMGSRTINFQDECRFVWPGSIGPEEIVGRGSHEHVRKSRRSVSSSAWVVTHPE